MTSPSDQPADPPIHLVVLYGGQSAEHDVSCVTAAHVMRAADPSKYTITPIGIGRDGAWALGSGPDRTLEPGAAVAPLDPRGTAISPVEAVSVATSGRTVVMPLLHGPMGEDGTVQGFLELAGVPYVGSGVLASALGMDKAMAKQVLAANHIPQARWRAVRDTDIDASAVDELIADLGLPMFVKPANMGSSVGVTKAKTAADVGAALATAATYDEWVVCEEAITGREIEVAVLGNLRPRATVPGEIVPGAEFYDYADKYLDGASQTLVPANLTPDQADEVRDLAVTVFRTLRCEGLARVDFFFEESGRGFLCNEVNTMPGFTPISMYPKLWLASGLTYAGLIDELVALALDRHSRQRRNTTH